jgi:hypothetical protein
MILLLFLILITQSLLIHSNEDDTTNFKIESFPNELIQLVSKPSKVSQSCQSLLKHENKHSIRKVEREFLSSQEVDLLVQVVERGMKEIQVQVGPTIMVGFVRMCLGGS